MGKVEKLTNGTTGGPVFVDVDDGKILRIYPMDLDETDAPSWSIEARGRNFTPPRRTTVMPYTAGHKSMIYSPKRVLTPLKRDRGSVILAARLTERVPAGTVHSYESCAEYDPLGTPGESPDRGGCVNILTSIRLITPTSWGMSNNSCMIQVEKWEGPTK